MENKGQLEKVKIHAYSDSKLNSLLSTILLPVNPESYTRNFKVAINIEQGQGNQGTKVEYTGTKPEELKLDFIFDGTGTIQQYNDNGKKDVKEQIKAFMDIVYTMNGDIHRPNFLKVQWGDLMFPCVLTNLDLNYTLFNANGDPLRVKASASFTNHIAQEERVRREGKNSPDLTHRKMFKAGDRLHNMVEDIYDSSKYILQIAKVNRLSSFRNVPIGTQLIFPPLDKTE